MPEKDTQKYRQRLWKIFLSTLYLSAFTFGGGYVIVTLMKKKFVDEYHWIGEDEMLDLVAIAQSTPGAIAVNASILVGWRVAGPVGVAVSVVGTVLPPLVILTVISAFYAAFSTNRLVALALKGMQAGVAAVICDVVLGLGTGVAREKDPVNIAVMLLAFAAGFVLKINVIYIILIAGLLGLARALIRGRRAK